jgi:hypothetical protein
MNIPPGIWIAIVLMTGIGVGSGTSLAACRWWYGRKLLAAAHRLQKADKGRLFSQEQTLQAKRQIEVLKTELAALQLAPASTQGTRQRKRELEESLAVAERESAPDSGLMPLPAAHGFADTQLLP